MKSNSETKLIYGETSNMDAFLNPPYQTDNLDRYLIRSAILRKIKENLGCFEGSLLDVGCGQMPYKSLLLSPPAKVIEYIGLDFVDSSIHQNKPDIIWNEGKIPLDSDSIDCAICTEVFEHCPEPEAVMTEINRVLKKNGRLFFTVPYLWPLHEVPYDEYRYTPFSLKRHLINSGFAEVRLEALGGWDASLAQLLGLWVRRRPMGERKRKVLSAIIFPLYKLLIKIDCNPAEFRESTMITGFSGICLKNDK